MNGPQLHGGPTLCPVGWDQVEALNRKHCCVISSGLDRGKLFPEVDMGLVDVSLKPVFVQMTLVNGELFC